MLVLITIGPVLARTFCNTICVSTNARVDNPRGVTCERRVDGRKQQNRIARLNPVSNTMYIVNLTRIHLYTYMRYDTVHFMVINRMRSVVFELSVLQFLQTGTLWRNGLFLFNNLTDGDRYHLLCLSNEPG